MELLNATIFESNMHIITGYKDYVVDVVSYNFNNDAIKT